MSKNSYTQSADNKDLIISGNSEITQAEIRNGRDHTLIVNVSIENGIPGVGNEAFSNCYSLASIFLPPSIQYINKKAFSYCSALSNITFSEGITTLVEDVFFVAGITKLSFPKSLINVDFSFLTYGTPLSYISFDKDHPKWTSDDNHQFVLTKDKKTALMCVSSPSALYLPSYVEVLQEYFANNRLTSLKFESDSNLTTVKSLAFRQSPMKSISFPHKLVSLGSNVFWMGGLESVTLPASLTSLHVNAFDTLDNLKSVIVEDGNPVLKSLDGILYDVNFTQILFIPPVKSNLTLPSTIKEISGTTIQSSALEDVFIDGSDVFDSYLGVLYKSNCKILYACPGHKLDVTVCDNCTEISASAFKGCWLRSINFGNAKISQIGIMGFYKCKNLSTIEFSSHLSAIYEYAFDSDIKLSGNIKFYSALTTLKPCAFPNCGEMNVDMSECIKIKSLPDTLFSGSKLMQIKLPPNLESISANCFQGALITTIDFGEHLQLIEESAFLNCVNLNSIINWGKVHTIEDSAFSNTGFVSLNMPSTLKDLCTNVISRCKKLESVVFEEDSLLESVRVQSFQNSNALKRIQFGKNVNNFADGAFAYTYALTTIDISLKNPIYRSENGVVIMKKNDQNDYETIVGIGGGISNVSIPSTIGDILDKAFQACTNIEEILFDTKNSQLKIIKSYLFLDCANLRKIAIPNSILKICTESFRSLSNLLEFDIIDIQNNFNSLQIEYPLLNSIENKAFQDCSSLENINFGECTKLVYIGSEAFKGCKSLKRIKLPHSLQEIQEQCFYECIQLESIRLPGSLLKLESESFGNCINFQHITFCGNHSIKTENVFMGTKAKIAEVSYIYEDFEFCGLPIAKVLDSDCNFATQLFTETLESHISVYFALSLICDINDCKKDKY